jgi:hypothetical protein
VLTSDKLAAGTGAKVCLQFTDTEGRSWSPQLAQTPEHFHKGGRDHLLLSCAQPLGQVASARVWLEGGGASAFWHLQELRLTDLQSYAAWRFAADDWVPRSLGPNAALLLQAQALPSGAARATSAHSAAASQSQLLARVSVGQLPPTLLQSGRRSASRTTSSITGAPVELELVVVTGDRFGAGTDAAVHVEVLGPGGAVAASEALPRAPGLFERKGGCLVKAAPAQRCTACGEKAVPGTFLTAVLLACLLVQVATPSGCSWASCPRWGASVCGQRAPGRQSWPSACDMDTVQRHC